MGPENTRSLINLPQALGRRDFSDSTLQGVRVTGDSTGRQRYNPATFPSPADRGWRFRPMTTLRRVATQIGFDGVVAWIAPHQF